MNGILSGAIAAGLLATAGFLTVGQNGEHQSAATRGAAHESASLPGAGRTVYSLQIGGGAQSCILAKGGDGLGGSFAAVAGPKCPALYPPLAEVRLWREKDDGTVELARGDGTMVLELAVSDGFAYETFRPGSPLISLVATAE